MKNQNYWTTKAPILNAKIISNNQNENGLLLEYRTQNGMAIVEEIRPITTAAIVGLRDSVDKNILDIRYTNSTVGLKKLEKGDIGIGIIDSDGNRRGWRFTRQQAEIFKSELEDILASDKV
jgi:hypothetical protein